MSSNIINIPVGGRHVWISGRSNRIRSFGKTATISSTGSKIRIFARFCASQETFWIHIVESNKYADVEVSVLTNNLWVSISHDIKSLTAKGPNYVIVTQHTGYDRYGTFMHDKKFEAALNDEMAMKVTMIGTNPRMSVVGERARSLVVASSRQRSRRRRSSRRDSESSEIVTTEVVANEEKESISEKQQPLISEKQSSTLVFPRENSISDDSEFVIPEPSEIAVELEQSAPSQQDFANYMNAFRNDRSKSAVGPVKASYISPIIFVPDVFSSWRAIST